MEYIDVKDHQNETPVKICYEDVGEGSPVVLIHGWPLSKEMWEYQVTSLVEAGYRVISYDRRGFGMSSHPWNGYDYDTFADDLKELLDQLNLEQVTLVGFSMGGGEIVRYFSRHGGQRVVRAALISAVTPYLLKTDDNRDGVDRSTFIDMMASIKEDRIAFLDDFGKKFFGVNFVNKPVSTQLMDYFRMLAAVASPRGTMACLDAFAYTDFRDEMHQLTVPTLIVHGDSDKVVPPEPTSYKAAKEVPDNHIAIYSGAPHGLFITERDQLNKDLIEFIREAVTTAAY
ncbi:MAG TPA: alpha/beta hydrolase [Cyclobacteriaceae bacterium]